MSDRFRLEIAYTSFVSLLSSSKVQTQPPVVTGKGNTHLALEAPA